MKRILLCTALISLPLAAQASLGKFFESLDVDGDRLISFEEAQAAPCLARNYDRIQRESAKGLGFKEFKAAATKYCQNEGPSGGGEHQRPAH